MIPIPVVHLVLYSASKYYVLMYYSSRVYYARWNVHGVRTIYYTYRPEQKEPFVYDEAEQMLWIRDGNERCIPCAIQNNPGVYEKTVTAFEWVQRTFDYQYLVRSNISTLVNFTALLPRLSQVTGYAGCTLNFPEAGGVFVRGTSILLTRGLIDRLLTDKSKMDLSMVDDVGLAKVIREHLPDAYPPLCFNAHFRTVPNFHGDYTTLRSFLTPDIRETIAFFRFKAQEAEKIFDRNIDPCRIVDVMQLTFLAEWLSLDPILN